MNELMSLSQVIHAVTIIVRSIVYAVFRYLKQIDNTVWLIDVFIRI